MKAIVAILLLAATGATLADTAKPADRPIIVYKAGKPYIFDTKRIPATNTPAVVKPTPVKPLRAIG